MIAKGVGCLLLVFLLADARVDFVASKVYDEFDFKGHSSVTVDRICAVTCAIYASITPESKNLASNLLIQMPKGFVSIADVAAQIDPATHKKLPLIVNGTLSLTIVNANANLAAGPLVLYIINSNYTRYPEYKEVYEAEGFDNSFGAFPAYVTVMSARPFTLHQDSREETAGAARQGMKATMSGLDELVHNAPCWALYFEISFVHHHEFTMEVNGPIVSVSYDHWLDNTHELAPVHFNASIGITNKRSLDTSGWVGSPGAHGCPGKQPYRSSLYDLSTPIHAEMTTDNPISISLDVGTNTNTVTITDSDSGIVYSVNSTEGRNPTYYNLKTKNLTVDWTPSDTGNDYFLVQWNATRPN